VATIIQNLFPWMIPKGFVNPQLKPGDKNKDLSNADNNLDSQTTGIVALQLDALMVENLDLNAAPTRSEVEDGSIISDHVTLNPMKLTIEGVISNTPVSVKTFLGKTTVLSSPVQDAHKKLSELYRNRTPFDFVGGLQVYKGMVLTNYNPTRNSKTGSVLQFTASMEQIRTVHSQVVPVEKIAPAEQKLGAKTTSKGTTTVKIINPSQQQAVDAWGNSSAEVGRSYNFISSTKAMTSFQQVD
jgi:hypothetical protein